MSKLLSCGTFELMVGCIIQEQISSRWLWLVFVKLCFTDSLVYPSKDVFYGISACIDVPTGVFYFFSAIHYNNPYPRPVSVALLKIRKPFNLIEKRKMCFSIPAFIPCTI